MCSSEHPTNVSSKSQFENIVSEILIYLLQFYDVCFQSDSPLSEQFVFGLFPEKTVAVHHCQGARRAVVPLMLPTRMV